jgi:hypothetical protein
MRDARVTGMLRFLRRFATSMSCFIMISCGSSGTSVNSPISCDQLTCHEGQLCRPAMAEPDDGGIPGACVDVPFGCEVFDCDTQSGPACSTCLQSMCGCSGSQCYIDIQARELRC